MSDITCCDEIVVLLLEFFDDDLEKMKKWINASNPLLGGTTPHIMVQNGEERRLLRFIKNQLEGNTP